MNAIQTAEQLFDNLQRLPRPEREKFFLLLSSKAFEEPETLTHGELFGHLQNAELTATEAAEYLEVSVPTFRRYVKAGRIKAASEVGTSHLYRLADLRHLKATLHPT